MHRREDWPERLNAYFDSVRASPFQFGTLDCCLYVAGAVEAMTGEDLASEWRGTYEDADGAIAALSQWGSLETMLEAMATEFGWHEVGPKYVKRGDILLLSGIGDRDVPGIYMLPIASAFVEGHGLFGFSRSTIARAWHFD